MKNKLILGSSSPRRKELLTLLGIKFEVMKPEVDEACSIQNPLDYVKEVTMRKGKHLFKQLKSKSTVLISADTIVVSDDLILGKPKDRDEAKRMLKLLSGKTHEVITGVWIKSTELKDDCYFATRTQVKFNNIMDFLLENYLATNDSLDKAGAYGIQSGGLPFIDSINGSYSNIVGFPLSEFCRKLKTYLNQNNEIINEIHTFF